ncbi:MAG: PilZ domain-containing protein [Sedimentisphaerales bacterium]|nr:PilZ domain-containing protein [Sedimentisphaerales bacterium]
MSLGIERRRDRRVQLLWPIWFGYAEDGEFFRGQIVDLSQGGVSFSIERDNCPEVGTHLRANFSFPQDIEEEFDMGSYSHWAEVLRVDKLPGTKQRVAMRLHERLSSEPCSMIPEAAFATALN